MAAQLAGGTWPPLTPAMAPAIVLGAAPAGPLPPSQPDMAPEETRQHPASRSAANGLPAGVDDIPPFSQQELVDMAGTHASGDAAAGGGSSRSAGAGADSDADPGLPGCCDCELQTAEESSSTCASQVGLRDD